MLDKTTKTRIDTARDILVGKVPNPQSQVELITIAMIYKFMDDMDMQNIEFGGNRVFFTDDLEQYAWRKVLSKKLNNWERISLYAEALDKLQVAKQIPELFRKIFKGAFLPFRDGATLTLFLNEIDGFSYNNSENLGNAFEYLLSIMGSQGDAGQFRTPRHIIDFIVEVVNPSKTDTILDPACGTAGFLISAYKHIMEQAKETKKPLTPAQHQQLMQNIVDEYHLVIDDAKSLAKMFADNPAFKLEHPMDIMRRTILLVACGMSEDTEGIEYLINKGAEINRNDLMGENALMYVIQNPNMPTEEKLKAVQLLIDHGIDVNWLNSRFETPLMMALNQIEIEVAELLIDNGGVVYQPPKRPKEPDTEEENKE